MKKARTEQEKRKVITLEIIISVLLICLVIVIMALPFYLFSILSLSSGENTIIFIELIILILFPLLLVANAHDKIYKTLEKRINI